MSIIVSDYAENHKVIGSYGITFLDDLLGGVAKSDFVLIGASSGAGKTELAYNIAFNNPQLNVFIFALEADKDEPIIRKMYKMLSHEYYENKSKYKTVDMNYQAFQRGQIDLPDLIKEIEDEYFRLYSRVEIFYKEIEFTIHTLHQRLTELSRRFSPIGNDLIIIDHIDYFDIVSDAENQEISNVMNLLRKFTQDFGVPVILVSHMKKKGNRKQIIPELDDFYGTSNKVKQVKTAIVVSPDYKNYMYEYGLFPTFFSVLKNRVGGQSNIVASCTFNSNKNTYSDKYDLLKVKNYGEEVEELEHIPKWAINANGYQPPRQIQGYSLGI
jgi:replicative DNA helicase